MDPSISIQIQIVILSLRKIVLFQFFITSKFDKNINFEFGLIPHLPVETFLCQKIHKM